MFSLNLHLLRGIYPICLLNSSIQIPVRSLSQKVFKDEDDKRKEVETWLQILKFEGVNVPEYIKKEHMDILVSSSRFQRESFLNYLRKIENSKKKRIQKKILKSEQVTEKYSEKILSDDPIVYGVWQNSMFTKLRPKLANRCYDNKMAILSKFAQNVVIDCRFDHVQRESSSFARQLMLSILYNRNHKFPCNLHLCNINTDSGSWKCFDKMFPASEHPLSPVNILENSYSDYFPKKNLVYLCPNASEEMRKLDPNAVYIIGGLVDLRCGKPLTLGISKEENIKAQRLPLDRYCKFQGSKSLAIHIVYSILLDLQLGDWNFALNNIPARLLKNPPSDTSKNITGKNYVTMRTKYVC